MNNPYSTRYLANEPFYTKPKRTHWSIHLLLFLATFLTCTIAGTLWAGENYLDISKWSSGLTYAVLVLTFLSAHEFGHYFAARYHKVDATLPYYIPIPIPEIMLFGTFGAVIKTRSPITSKKALFDIGVAGPISGFIVCLIFLIIGFQTLPPKEFIYTIHPQYQITGVLDSGLHFGDTILFSFMSNIFANPNGWLPPMNEVYHYPFLCVGWFGLFVTALNMLPLGQLDGGHVTYAMFGEKQHIIAKYVWWLIVIIGSGSVLALLYELLSYDNPSGIYIFLQNTILPILSWIKKTVPWYFNGWGGWIFWGLITRLFIKLKHPVIYDNTILDRKRKIIGWIALIALLLSFSYNGIYFVE